MRSPFLVGWRASVESGRAGVESEQSGGRVRERGNEPVGERVGEPAADGPADPELLVMRFV